jgi:long-chain fatty acid transport protein
MRKFVVGARLAPVFGLAAATAVGLAAEAHASGFQLKEQSAEGLGNAFAGSTAKAKDLSTIFFNPAGMTALSGHQSQAVVSYIIPRAEFRADSATLGVAGTPPLSGARTQGDAINDAVVPAAYAMYDHTDRVKFGLAINVPFGLVTDYDDDWVGRYHALKSDLQTIAIQPSIAYKVNDWLSVGGGPVFQYASAELTKAVDVGALGGAPGTLALDGKSKVTGDDLAVGYTLGVMLQPLETTRVGLSYRSAISHNLQGDVKFTNMGAAAANPNFRDGSGSAKLNLPATASVGVYHEVNDQLALMADVSWTQWSDFRELSVFRAGDPAGVPLSSTNEDWDDTWFTSIGATYKPMDKLNLQIGLAYDQSPVPDAARARRRPHLAGRWCRLRVHAGCDHQSFVHPHLGR